MPLDLTTIAETSARYAARDPREILELALREYSPRVGLSFSGAEDVVLIDMAVKIGTPFRVFSLDTGRLHPEAYRFLDQVRSHYGINNDTFAPNADAVQNLVSTKGFFSFYVDGHKECCGMRKVEPLVRAL